MAKRLTTEEWIQRAREVHGDRYDYSNVNYVRSGDKVVIVCKKHGKFEQKARGHTNGMGCAVCGQRKITKEEWIRRAKDAHGGRYDYSLTKYVNSTTKVIIICPDHGEFEQMPAYHARGQGCPRCQYDGKRLTTEEWIQKARAAHGDRYDYSLTKYVHSKTNVIIICPDHGEFEQLPTNHARGLGCQRCYYDGLKLATEEWIQKAMAVHEDRYDYSKVVYSGADYKVSIVCPDHGAFEQSPKNHAQGQGCPRCPARYNEPTDIYILTNGEQVKVGIALDPEGRLSQLDKKQPFTAELVATWTLTDHPQARKVESEVHRRLADLNSGLSGFDGATEWFNTTPAHTAETINQVIKEMGL